MNRFFGKAKPKAPPPSLTDCIGTVREGRGLGWGEQGAGGGQELLWKKSCCGKSPSIASRVNVCHRILVAENLRCFLAVFKPKRSSKYV